MSTPAELYVVSKEDLEEAVYDAMEEVLPLLLEDLDLPREQTQEWLSTREAMAYLSFSKSTLQRYRDRGLLPFRKTETGAIRYRREDLNAVLEKRSASSRDEKNT